MTCTLNQPYYIPEAIRGIKLAASKGDANIISLFWYEAFPQINFDLAYNIYFSTEKENVFSEGPKFVSTNLEDITGDIYDLTPGDIYYFAVRATEYLTTWYNISSLPSAPDGYSGLKFYPETLLANNISDSDTNIPVADIDIFPPFGVVQIGVELIRYENIDLLDGYLIAAERGFLNTAISQHDTDGYDGTKSRSPIITFFAGFEEKNTFVIQEENKFSYPNYAYTLNDGYREKTEDFLNTDLSSTETNRTDNWMDTSYTGWHRNSPEDIFKGKCLDTYIGGEQFCVDGYSGVGMQIRNVSFAQEADRRDEELLEQTGEPVVLVKRIWKGIVCRCVEPNKETPESRCPKCYNTGFITGFEQYYNPRRSDGRILIRFNPASEDLKRDEPGIENVFVVDCWGLVVPIIKDSDFLIRFNDDGSEEFRYEILNVNRVKLLYGESGSQHFSAQRIRKTDIIYSWNSFNNTATMPLKLNTTVGLLRGKTGVQQIPHVHQIVVSENITALSQINQTTSYAAGHSHSVVNGILSESLGHSHFIIL